MVELNTNKLFFKTDIYQTIHGEQWEAVVSLLYRQHGKTIKLDNFALLYLWLCRFLPLQMKECSELNADIRNTAEELMNDEHYDLPVTCIALSPDGRYVLMANVDFSSRTKSIIRLLNLKDGTEISKQEIKSVLKTIAFNSNGQSVMTINDTGLIQEWGLPIQ